MVLSALFGHGLARARSMRRNVLDYGAVGDGTTDDTAAFAAAQAGSDPIELFVPPAVYVGRFVLRSNVRVWAPGATLKLQVSAGAGDIAARVVTIGESSLAENVSIYGATIDGVRGVGGPYPASPDAARIGVSIGWAYNILLQDLVIRDCYTDGVLIGYLHDGSSNITMDSVAFNNNWRHGLTISSGNKIAVRGCTFTDNGGDHAPYGSYGNGIDVEDEAATQSGVNDLTIADCEFSGNVGADVGISSFYGWSKGTIAVSGCTCSSSTPEYSIGVYLSSETDFDDIVIDGNVCAKSIACLGADSGQYNRLRVTQNKAPSVVVGDSTASTTYLQAEVRENECDALRVDGAIVDGWMNVDDNVVTAEADPDSHYDIGINLVNIPAGLDAESLRARRNVVTGGCYGISVAGESAVLLEDNNVSAQRSVSTLGGQGIVVGAGAAHVIDGNTVDDAEGRGIYAAADGVEIADNTVTDCAYAVGSSAGIYIGGNDCEVSGNTATGNVGEYSLGDIYDGGSNNNIHDNVTT